MTQIVQIGNDVLRATAEPVADSLFGTPELFDIIKHMKEALDSQDDGAALAAPQIGVSLRIFIISERVFGPGNKDYGSQDPHFIFINPYISKRSKKGKVMDEGCLSVRGKYGTVRRAVGATVTAQDEHGRTFTRGAGGLLAQVFQHETDHLDGVLFIDHAEEVWTVDRKRSES